MLRKHNPKLVSAARTLRKDMTPEERRLWYVFLRGYPVRFQRQKILGHFIADFYCASAKLVIELDGSQHYEPDGLQRDAERTAILEEYGLSVIRISNRDINTSFDSVCEHIDLLVKQALDQSGHSG